VFQLTYRALLTLMVLTVFACRVETIQPVPIAPITKEVAEGATRSYMMGFSSLPAALTESAYLETYDIASAHGEALLIQRSPAWADFLPGAKISEQLRSQTLAQKNATSTRGLELIYVLDPFTPETRMGLHGLPDSHHGQTLSNIELRDALVADALFVARNFRPAYLVIGNEINVVFERDPKSYSEFVSVYSELYDAVKRAVPSVRVLTSFQYEEFLGVVPWLPSHTARWNLLKDFEGRLDQFGVTSYPSFAFTNARKIEPSYYEQIRDHTDLPIAFVSVGYASGAGREGINSTTPAEQRRYLQRLLEDADNLNISLLIWLIARDLSYLTTAPENLASELGLHQADGTPKEAWDAWLKAYKRPYNLITSTDTQ